MTIRSLVGTTEQGAGSLGSLWVDDQLSLTGGRAPPWVCPVRNNSDEFQVTQWLLPTLDLVAI
jgi:hypothetical protein